MIALIAPLLFAMRPLVVGYVPNWNDLAAFAPTIDYGRVTHLNVAFENPRDDGGSLSFNPSDDLVIQAAHAKGVKVLVSIGGGAVAGKAEMLERYSRLLDAKQRTGFVATLAAYVSAHGFDGLDVDLEGPAVDGNYGAFIRDLGKALKAQGKLLTAALSQGYGGERVPREAFASFDFVNVMAYDATGPWSPDQPGQHSSLQFAKDNVAYWLARGLPRSKTVLGVPFYGYGFGVSAAGEEWSYRRILAAYPQADLSDRAGSTIWYNGPATIRAKAKYTLEQGLAGVMIWSLDSDAEGAPSLLRALDSVLRPDGKS